MIHRTLTHGVETVFIPDMIVGNYRIREVMGGYNIQHVKSKKWMSLQYTTQKAAIAACKRGMETGKCKPVVSRFETVAPNKPVYKMLGPRESAYRESKDATIRARQKIVKGWTPPKKFLATHIEVVCVGGGDADADAVKNKILTALS